MRRQEQKCSSKAAGRLDSIVSNPPHSAPRSSVPPYEMTLNKPQYAPDESSTGPAPAASKVDAATASRQDEPSTVRRTTRSTAVLPTITERTSDPQQSHRAALGHAFDGKSRGSQAGYPGQRPAQARPTPARQIAVDRPAHSRPPSRQSQSDPRQPQSDRCLSSQRMCRKS